MKPPLEEFLCSICLEILIEPVTLPCHHELCMPCFQNNINNANFCCPFCRVRISSWARIAANKHDLIDRDRWRQVRKCYPAEVKSRMSGRSDSDSIIMPPVHENPRVLSKPGEIRREYEEELRKFEEQLKLEREQEETASRLCIEKMLKIDAAQKQIEEEDKIITRQIKSNAVQTSKKATSSSSGGKNKIGKRYDLRKR